jgi:phage baseplate assembly protein gpV
VSTALLYDSIARIARHEAHARSIAAVAEVTNVHPADGAVADHAVTIRLRESGLALPRVPIAVGVLGFAAIPAVGDLVVVVFADGDLHNPVVIGRLYRSEVAPPQHKEGQIVLRLPSPSSSPTLNFEITTAPPTVKVTLPDDVLFELTGSMVHAKAGDAELTLDARGRIEAKVGDASITMKKDGTVQVKAKDFSVTASGNLELKASGSVKVKGATVELN